MAIATRKMGGRRPKIQDQSLEGVREFLVWLLESTWSEVGIMLPKIKTIKDVRLPFEFWQHHRGQYVVECLLRPSYRRTTAKKLKKLHFELSQLNNRMRDASELQQQCRDSVDRAARAINEPLSPD